MERFEEYFLDDLDNDASRTLQSVGAEVETQFVDAMGAPITTETSQAILKRLASGTRNRRWEVESRKGDLITVLVDRYGNKIFYELGRHNLEVATAPVPPACVTGLIGQCLDRLYGAARFCGAEPYFGPVLETDEDLLVIPDERDAVWMGLDGRPALAPLARTSAVHFTVSVSEMEAAGILTRLGWGIESFLADFPQDTIWRRYIAESSAGYRPDRYGGPLAFSRLDDYFRALAVHDVVMGNRLMPFSKAVIMNMSLHLRSIWWHFRLKRYEDTLCVEVRPIPRRTDAEIPRQLEKVLGIIG